MKLIFMGTPAFAAVSLEKLAAAGHEIAAVFTRPDKPVGRKAVLTAPPVKQAAEALGLPVFQPSRIKAPENLEIIRGIAPDAIAVVAYGMILPEDILAVPPLGCVNLHGSLLPAYRGSAPVQWAVANGESRTGVTTMLMDAGLDTGDMLLRYETDILPDETSGELLERLSVPGAELLLQTLDGLRRGEITPKKQDEAAATHAPMITKEMGALDFSRTPEELAAHVRGMNPWPIAHTRLGGKNLKVFAARPGEEVIPDSAPGTAVAVGGKLYAVCAGGSSLELLELMLEGSKRLSAREFLNGRKISAGETFGN